MQKTLLLILSVFFFFSFKQTFSQANAGPDQEICYNYTTMQATDPAPDFGQWIVLGGSGTFADPTLYNTLVTDILPGINLYRWEVTIGVDVYFDDVIITNNKVTAEAGPDQTICSDATFLNATSPTVMYPFQGTGHWTNLSGNGAVLNNPLAYNTSVSNLPIGTTAFEWTVELGSCQVSDMVQITNESVYANAIDAETSERLILIFK